MDNRKQMFDAVCSTCGNNCQVPFKPTGSKPVLCSDCFGNKGGKFQKRSGDRSKKFGDRNSRSGDRQMHQAVCDKCGKECEVPFRPTAGKPIYCNECFGKSTGHRDRPRGAGNDQVFQQLSALSSKLDRVLSLLDSGASVNKSQAKETVSKSAQKKPATGKKTAKKAAKRKK